MATTRVTASPLVAPEDVGRLVLEPLTQAAVCTRPGITTVVRTDRSSYRVPVLRADGAVGFVAEGAEIPLSSATFDEVIVVPQAIKGLDALTSELLADAEGNAAQLIGDRLINATAAAADKAFFSVQPSPAPSGIAAALAATGSEVQKVNVTGAWASLDPFIDAAALVEQAGANVTGWVANPVDLQALSKLKTASGSLVPLLPAGNDPTQPARRVIEGRPVYASNAVAAGTVWGLDASRVLTVLRQDAEVVTDAGAYFSSDRIGVRVTVRLAWGIATEAAIVAVKRS